MQKHHRMAKRRIHEAGRPAEELFAGGDNSTYYYELKMFKYDTTIIIHFIVFIIVIVCVIAIIIYLHTVIYTHVYIYIYRERDIDIYLYPS